MPTAQSIMSADEEAKAALVRSLAAKEANAGELTKEELAMGAMSDAEVVEWFLHSDTIKRVTEKTGMSLEDIVNGGCPRTRNLTDYM